VEREWSLTREKTVTSMGKAGGVELARIKAALDSIEDKRISRPSARKTVELAREKSDQHRDHILRAAKGYKLPSPDLQPSL
jgi:hypothetical protein